MVTPNNNLIRYLNEEDVISCGGANIEFYLRNITEVFRLHASSDFHQPPGAYLRRGDYTTERTTGRIIALPAYIGGQFDSWGVKWVASCPMNPKGYNLPRASATIILNDLETGVPIAIMNGTLISAMRTGAVTTIAAHYLANPDSEVTGLIGAGPIMYKQIDFLLHALQKIETIKVYDIDEEKTKSLIDYIHQEFQGECVNCTSAKEAVIGSDALITATTVSEGYIEGEWLKEGLFFSNVSLQDAKYSAILKADKIVVDDWQHANKENRPLNRMVKEGLINANDIYAEIGEIVTGRKKGRESRNEIIYFNPMGLGIEDIACARAILSVAEQKGIGLKLKM